MTPVAQKMMEVYSLSIDEVLKGLRRITKQNMELAREAFKSKEPAE